MSKYIKYISSDHFGAPIMKGDRWGYCVEMLRKCLVEGFNEHTDLIRAEVIDVDKVKYTFTTPHNYVANQTIKISGISFPELNGDVFINASDANSVTCTPYTNVSGMVGQVIDNITAKAIVAPLGFKEKFKDGNRSVFVTDEEMENAYFYIDDREPPTRWKNTTNGNTNITCPIVFMTDKMTDIDNAIGAIVPFDTANPDYYKKVDYNPVGGTTAVGMGIWNWITFGISAGTSSNYPNTPAIQQVPIKWEIIGNGRLFYFMPQLLWGGNIRKYLYSFGKHEEYVKKDSTKFYILTTCISQDQSSTQNGAYSYRRLTYTGGTNPFNNLTLSTYSSYPYQNTDLGKTWQGVLKYKNIPINIYFSPVQVNAGATINLLSGSYGNYPDGNTKKYYTSRINAFNLSGDLIGKMSGMLWTYNSSSLFMSDCSIKYFKYKNKKKKVYIYNNLMCSGTDINPSTSSNYIYNISLEYEDWNNYE